jgi:hypothetical protein
MTDIIIIKYNNKKVEDDCVKSIVEFTDSPYNLTLYDNFPNNHNLGKLWNRLIEKSDCENICLLNSDTEVSKSWLRDLEIALEEPLAGCVGPSTDNCHNQQAIDTPEEIFVDFGKTYPNWCLSGFCILFPKKIWEECGGFPEDFGFYGQEVAFLDKVMKLGYKQIWRTDVFIHHIGSSSAKKAQTEGKMDEFKEREIGSKKIKEFRSSL